LSLSKIQKNLEEISMRTVTGLFDTRDDARNAVTALEAAGIPSKDISIVAHDGTTKDETSETKAAEGAGTGAGVGAVAGGGVGLLTGLGVMAIPGVGPVVAAGWLAATAAGAVAGAVAGGAAGGIIGSLVSAGVPEEHAHVYAEGVRRGGSIVVAKVDEAKVDEASAILKRSNLVDPVERRRTYEQDGWSRFDDTRDPYSHDEIAAEQRRYQTLR
jgi:hypothetical protein